MDFDTLLRSHQALLAENKALKEENQSLKLRIFETGSFVRSAWRKKTGWEEGWDGWSVLNSAA
jgi:hypothetical protein